MLRSFCCLFFAGTVLLQSRNLPAGGRAHTVPDRPFGGHLPGRHASSGDPWGRAADRIGHRRTLVICSTLFALSKVVFWKARASGLPRRAAHPGRGSGGALRMRFGLPLRLRGREGEPAHFRTLKRHADRGPSGCRMSASLFLSEHYRRGPCGLCSATLPPRCSHFCSPTRRRMGKSRRPPRPGRGWAAAPPEPPMTPFLAGSALLAETAQFITVFLSQLLYQRPGSPSGRSAGSPCWRRSAHWPGPAPTGSPGVWAAAGARAPLPLCRRGVPDGAVPRPLPAVAGVLGLRAAAALFSPLAFLSRTPLQSRAPGLRSSPATPWSWIWYPWS